MATLNSGIINPPIDDLLKHVDSKFGLVIFASKRARQINAYYSDLHDGTVHQHVGPLVDSGVEDESLSVALREVADDVLVLTRIDASAVARLPQNSGAEAGVQSKTEASAPEVVGEGEQPNTIG